MPQPANTFSTWDAQGDREDLEDVIYNISPTETPFVSMLPRGKARNVRHEWQTDALAAPGQNANIEGDDANFDPVQPTVRVSNMTQILDKAVVISGTQEEVEHAGRASEVAYEVAKKGKELKRDIEWAAVRNQPSQLGNATTPRLMAGAESWLATNVSRGATGASGGYNPGTGVVSAPVDGTQRAFTEDLLKGVIQSVWSQGGDPTRILVGPKNKQAASGFAGIATQYRENKGTGQATIIAAADVYVSDFGTHSIVPDRFSRDRSALVLDPEYWALAVLRPIRTIDLARTGDSIKKQLLTELTLVCRNEAASGIVADLTT